MSAVSVTFRRTVGRARSVLTTAFAAAAFLAAVALRFSFGLETAEGGPLSLASVWTMSVSPVLPVLAALLGMGAWSDERQSGRAEVLLATAVRERSLVQGKFLGVLLLVFALTVLSLVASVGILRISSPEAVDNARLLSFLPALGGLFLQGMLWSAVTVAASAVCRRAASAAVLSVALTVGLPRGVWAGLMAWADKGRTAFGEMPLDAQALDMANGVIPVGVVCAYVVLTLVMLFVASKAVACLRLVGRGATGLRVSTGLAIGLSLVFAAVAVRLTSRIGMTLDIPVSGPSVRLSPRTLGILSETGGHVAITCFLSRKDVRFRPVSRLLRLLKRESESVGGARIDLQYVDPSWDIGAAERLVRRGVSEESLVFEKGRRMIDVPFRDGYGERICASAIRRLTANPRHRNIYWTIGHGEARFDEYGVFGMSDIARELARDGYRNQSLDLASAEQVPGNCAMIVVAGAKDSFSRVELGRLESYLREGGRLLVLTGAAEEAGLASLLPSWGIRTVSGPSAAKSTLSGTDRIVSEFAEHPISSSFRGLRIVLERPVSFEPSVAAETGAGADRIGYGVLASADKSTFAVVVERGAGAGGDLAIRPTRIVAIGDATFVMNGQLQSRANANRDFFLNCASYLSGTTVADATGTEADRLVTGMDRQGRFRHALLSVLVIPGVVFLLLAAAYVSRRLRK